MRDSILANDSWQEEESSMLSNDELYPTHGYLVPKPRESIFWRLIENGVQRVLDFIFWPLDFGGRVEWLGGAKRCLMFLKACGFV